MQTLLFKNIITKNEELLKFVRENHSRRCRLDENHTNLNYVCDQEFKYFLSASTWDLVYNKLCNNHLFTKGEDFNLLKNYQQIRLSNFEKVVGDHFKELLLGAEEIKLNGRPMKIKQVCDTLKYMVDENNIKEYCAVLCHKIEDLIMNALLKNELTPEFALELPETRLNNSLGNVLFDAYFTSSQIYTIFLYAKKAKDIALRESFFIQTFELYNKKLDNINTEEYKIISNEIKEKFKLTITNNLLIDVICKKLIILVIKQILQKPKNSKYSGIIKYFAKQQITNTQLITIQRILNSHLTENNVLLGSIVVNKLIEKEIFEVFQKPKYHKKKSLNTESLGETTLTVRFKQDLIYDFALNSSNFKPFLTETNQKQVMTDYKVYKQNFIINYKLSAINEQIHFNKTGTGIFNPKSLFANNKNISNIYISIDSVFLENYLNFLDKISGRKLNDIINENEKEDIYTFLSIYGVNFTKILSSIPLTYKRLFEELMEYGLDINENCDTIKFMDLKTVITNIPDIPLKHQFESILDKIRAYKITLIMALKEYISYSCFNYCIMPSYYDFRGRRYFTGLAFNIQSYPFLKAFIKIHEKSEKLINENNFNDIRKNVLNIIHDKQLKTKILEKMSSYTRYKENLSIEILKFLYAHIDNLKITFEEFQNLVFESSDDFLSLYKRILPIIIKSVKAIMIVSYILLERRKRNCIINYTNNYSYDMVTSGYQLATLLYPMKKMGIMSNLIGNDMFDLYADIGKDSLKTISHCLTLYQNIISEIPLDIWNDVHCNLDKFHQKEINYKIILELFLKYPDFCNIIRRFEDNLLKEEWILFTGDNNYLNAHTTKLNKCIIIWGRISFLKNIINCNPWLLKKNILGSRALMKHLIMIELYGGTRRGRETAYNQIITDLCMDLGTFFTTTKDKHMLFYFVENHYQKYRKEHLSGTQKIIKMGKTLAKLKNIIIIKNPNFICHLAPTKFVKSKRIIINLNNFHFKRKSYQLTLNKPEFSKFQQLTDSSLIINPIKLATLFPPDFIHSMDAMVPQLSILKLYKLNKSLKKINLRFNVISIHDNLAIGRFLFNILPELLMDNYRDIFDYNYFNTLRDNFKDDAEFQSFLDEQKVSDPFSKEDINNPHMMKYG